MFGRTRFSVLFGLLLIAVCYNSGFGQGEKKTAYAVLLDNTGSLRNQFAQVQAFGKGIVHRTCQHGPVSVFNFRSEGIGRASRALPQAGVEWSQDEKLLDRYIDNIYVQGGQTTLLDAIHFMADELNAKVDADKNAFGGKVIIVVTDGEDRVSTINEKNLIKVLRESGVTVYAVGLVSDLESDRGLIRKAPRDTAIDFLKSLTKGTGGGVIFPKGDQPAIEALLGGLLH
jgi:hypothetical protein